MSDYSFQLDSIVWSYTSVNTFFTCPCAFKKLYLDGFPSVQNAFSEWGSLMHRILEKYYKKELDRSELVNEYVSNYSDYLKHRFPYNQYTDLDEDYRRVGEEYLEYFTDLFSEYELISVEDRFRTTIEGIKFVGIIDLLLKDENGYVICDHKSKRSFRSKKEQAEYSRQLYLYAYHVHEKFGEFPKKLIFNMIRSEKGPVVIDFDKEKYDETINWLVDSVHKIYEEIDFPTCHEIAENEIEMFKQKALNFEMEPEESAKEIKKLESKIKGFWFFCNNLCSASQQCMHSRRYLPQEY